MLPLKAMLVLRRYRSISLMHAKHCHLGACVIILQVKTLVGALMEVSIVAPKSTGDVTVGTAKIPLFTFPIINETAAAPPARTGKLLGRVRTCELGAAAV